MEQYLEMFRRRKWVIILTTLVTCAVASLGTYLTPPTYSASTTLRIAQLHGGSMDYVEYMYAERLMNTYVEILRSRPIVEEVIQRLELSMMTNDLASKIEVGPLADTELMKIGVEDGNPRRARDIANTLAAVLMERSQNLYAGGGKSAREILQEQLELVESSIEQDRLSLESLMDLPDSPRREIDALYNKIRIQEGTYALLLNQYEEARLAEAMRAGSISVVEPAIEPRVPSKPRKKLNIMLGALVGLVGGMGLAFVFEKLDTTLYSTEQAVALTGLPILGTIPTVKIDEFRGQEAIPIYTNGHSPQGEAYRLLRTNILSLNRDTPLKTLLTTSAERGEGKTTVVANLAQAMAQAGRLVVAVDADLRAPALHHVFELPNEVGLSSILERQVSLAEALQDTGIPHLQVLTSGPVPSNPTELLGRPQMAALLETLVRAFDIVLLDTPSLLGVADALVLAPLVDGVAIVVAVAQARPEAVQAALKQSADVRGKLLGMIINRAEQRGRYYAREHPGKEVAKRGSRIGVSSSLRRLLISAEQRLSSLRKGRIESSTDAVQKAPGRRE